MQFPDFDSPSPTAQVWLLRQIETEINLVMYYPLLGVEEPFPNGSFSQWFTLVHERLTQWVQTTRQSATLSDKLEFHELHFQMQLLRLNRPSPRCPNPDSAMRKKALKASIDLIKGFSLIDRLEKLFYIWHGTYCIVEAGVCLLAAILTSMESASHDQAQTNLGGEDVGILIKYMKTFPCLVTKIASQWPDVAPHAVALDTVSRQSLESLQQWTRGEGTWRSDHEALKQKLNQFSQFSPLPSGPESPPTDDYTGSTVDGYPMVEQPAPETGFGDTSIPTGLQPPLQPGLMNPQSTLTQSNMGFPDPFSFDVGDAMAWDFSGLDSEEIFAALLENEPFPLGNIIT